MLSIVFKTYFLYSYFCSVFQHFQSSVSSGALWLCFLSFSFDSNLTAPHERVSDSSRGCFSVDILEFARMRSCFFFFPVCAPVCKKKTKRMKQPFGGSGVYPKNASPHFRALCLRRAEVAAQCHASQVGRLSHNFDEVSWSLL
jgi:hypothetical protein